MTGKPFLVTGATGNVGAEVVSALLEAGEPVRVAIRDPATYRGPSVETVVLDFDRPETYAAAVQGTRGLFLMRPPKIVAVESTLNRLIDAAADAGVESCAFLSVAGADRSRFIPHRRVETHLIGGRLPWTLLRAGFFAQNLTGAYREDIAMGRIVLPAAQGRVAFVDAVDLAAVAAQALRRPGAHAGQAYHLTGPAALSFSEVAGLLSQRLGRTVAYQPVSGLAYWRHARAQGMPAIQATVLTFLHLGLRQDQAAAVDPAVPDLLGRPARSLAQFIDANLTAWAQSAA